jgi:hypothetical protein
MTKLEYQLGIIILDFSRQSSEGELKMRIDKDDPLLKDMQKYEGEQIDKVHKCSQCGAHMPAGPEQGYFEDERAYGFCNDACLQNWNVDHGLEPDGSINFDRERWRYGIGP